ncbi:leucine carboxyl methyltransferase, putative [Coccidioides posadasii C735 delta SOWgp]|uniref:Leucine carboxyl methyltransferase 1 n=1 Tax=Coccidioides posadasii (strain C735) TaxID=222929 RepID=C5PAA0_COCP7|nr:leucine carboxyl methyltransferase, putative [Coccidioides posadasii C735 delta SOWgp]EER26662.1 leucine carboxyl methyltransferase, putative [Coccidioides posadasii C735 delta SOWgp]|eukprot:XP_003068807.1 leucine carboxyl methyltransferase, putative [Coccidioides posadasii C735 delta SOWgp]
MSASQIPNLNTLLRSRGGAGRGPRLRGRGAHTDSTSGHHGRFSQNDKVIQQTDNDASVSRLSAVELGYLDDPFARALSGNGGMQGAGAGRRYPIINRGTYVRTVAIDALVSFFLESQPEPKSKRRKRQIISLGAGSDTRIFRLLAEKQIPGSGEDYSFVYHELDFPTNTAAKIRTIQASPLLSNTLRKHSSNTDGDIIISEEGDALHSTYLHIHPIDLRSLSSLPSCQTRFEGIDTTLPTLIISECCLVYLSPTDASNVLSYFTTLFSPQATTLPSAESDSPTPLGLVLYEPIRPHDPFGKTMVTNLAARGIHLQTLNQYATLGLQRDRLRAAGFVTGEGAADIDFIWEKWVSREEKERVARLEMLDEIEEWRLLARHYCVAWGWRDGEDRGENVEHVFEAWRGVENQQDEGVI